MNAYLRKVTCFFLFVSDDQRQTYTSITNDKFDEQQYANFHHQNVNRLLQKNHSSKRHCFRPLIGSL